MPAPAIFRSPSRFAWDGNALLIRDAGGTDRLTQIERLGFTDGTVHVATLAAPPPPPPPPPPGATTVAFAAVTGGVRVSWGSDSVTLTGASLAAITAADIVFA